MKKKKIIYSVLREIERGETVPKSADLNLSLIEFRDLIDQIQDDDLIKGASMPKCGQGNPTRMVLLDSAEITSKGLNFLKQHSSFAETYPGLDDIKPWLLL
ncbi:MAG TPA: YjcQ family protein [Desulfosporosinus sp.]